MKLLKLIAIFGAFLAIPYALSQTTAPVLTVQCIAHLASCPTGAASLRDSNVGDTPAPFVAAQGYYVPGDGGGGDFYLFAAGTACSADDNGTAITNEFSDDAGDHTNCYHRRFTGTVYMAWFGVQNSTLSGTTYTSDVATACPGSTSCWTNAFNAAAQPSGNNTVSTGGMYLYSTAEVTPNPNQTFTCDAPYVGAQETADYSPSGGVKGTIVFGEKTDGSNHAAFVHFLHDHNEFHHCVILTNGSANPINLNPANCGSDEQIQRCALTDVQNMVANGDAGILCEGGENNYIHDVLVLGFDTGIASFQCSRWKLIGANIDASVGVSWQANKAPAYVSDVNVFPFMVSGLKPSQKTTSYAVSGIGSSGSPDNLCRVTFSYSEPSFPINVGDWVSLAGDKSFADEGPLSCYGTFKVAAVGSDYVDLQGTIYGDQTAPFMSTTGSWSKHSSIVTLASVSGVQAGECVTSSDGAFNGDRCNIQGGVPITNSVMVKDVSYYSHKIVIDQPTQTVPSVTTPPTLSFTNYGATSSTSTLYLYASSRIEAGYSIGGAAAGNVGTCFIAGGPGDSSNLAVYGNNNYCFAHRVQFNFNSAGPAVCTGCSFDGQAELFDIQQIGLRLGHGTDPLILSGTTGDNPCSGLGSTQCIDNTRIANHPYNPNYAGWRKGDALLSSNGSFPYLPTPTTISSITVAPNGDVEIALSRDTLLSAAQTFYDVKPLTSGIPTGTITSGSSTINLSADPRSAWNIGDQVIAPTVPGYIPAGARIVARTSSSITLDKRATNSASEVPIGNLSVWTPVNSNGVDIVGTTLGGGGGMVFDSAATNCNAVQGIQSNPNNPGQPGLEVVQGCMMLANIAEFQPNDFVIDGGATGVLMSSSSTSGDSPARIYFETDRAAQVFAGVGNLIGGGGPSNLMTFGDSSGTVCPPASQNVVAVFCGGDALGITGNTYKSCNPAYAPGGSALCPGTFLSDSGVLTHTNSANNPVFEFNDATQAVLPLPYQDGIEAAAIGSAKVLIGAEDVISTCVHISCSPDGVLLPSSAGWVDATTSLANSDCATAGGSCGVAGSLTVLNATSSPIKVWCASPDTFVNAAACNIGVSVNPKTSKTFYPNKGVGWNSN